MNKYRITVEKIEGKDGKYDYDRWSDIYQQVIEQEIDLVAIIEAFNKKEKHDK